MSTAARPLSRSFRGAALAVLAAALLAPALPAVTADAAPASAASNASVHKVKGKFAVFSYRKSALPAHKAGTRDRIIASDGTTASLVPDPPAAPARSVWTVNYDSGFTTAANGPAARAAFQAAVDIWSRIVASPVPIVVNASFANLGGNTLGQAASAEGMWCSCIGDGHSVYPIALANALTHVDQDAANPDIVAQFNSSPVVPFYYGTDGAPTSGTADFESVVLHELGHGLGFAGSMAEASAGANVTYSNPPMKWDSFMQDGASTSLVTYPSGSSQLTSALLSNNVSWNGPQGVAANGGTAPKLYAPAAWEQGSSGSHLDEATYPRGNANSLMTPSVSNQEAIHSPGAVAVAIMSDEGWNASIPLPAVPDAPTNVTATRGDGAAAVSWTASTDYGQPVMQYTVTAAPGGATCTTPGLGCTVNNLNNGTSYTFTVVPTNANGNGAASAASSPVVPAGKPAIPGAPTASPNNGGATVSWTAPSSNGDTISGYDVESSADGGQHWSTPLSSALSSSSTQATFTGLTNGAPYVFRVAAINTVGAGVASAASAPVTPVQTPDAPTNAQATRGDTQVTVNWTAPAPNGGPAITGYRLEWSSNGGATWSSPLTSALTNTSTQAIVTSLTNGSAYVFHIAAINSLGTGSFSSPSTAATPAGTPGTPTNVTGAPANSQVTLSWTAPSNNGDPITGYSVQWSTDNATWSTPLASATTSPATTAVVSGLTNLQAYYFRVAAINSIGTGLPVTTASTIAPAGTPTAPTNVFGTPGDTKATVFWSPPANNGGSPVTSYPIRISTDSGAHWSPLGSVTAPSAGVSISSLTNGTTYAFDVAATNANGTGPFSSTVFVTPAAAPGVPTSVSVGAGNGQVSVSWVAPSSNGGSAITGYDVQWSSNNGSTWSSPLASAQTSSATAALVTGLTNGTTYVFQVAARNAAGRGAFSPNTSSVTPAGAPSTPTAVGATAGDQQATVTWTPASNGGSPISSYDVRYSSNGGSSWTSANVAYAGSPALVTGLTNGTSYLFEVAAINGIGTSAYSAPTTAVTPSGLPGQPTAVSATAGNAQATVSWTAPSANGATITSYVVRYSSNNGTNWTTMAGLITASPTTVSGLTNGTTYVFDVAAHNINGDGAHSTPSTSVTPFAPATAPVAPTGVSATAADQSAAVSWTPGPDGGSPITSYAVQYSVDNGTWTTVSGTFAGSPATVGSLSNGHSYRFQVAATNSIGTSSYSPPSLAVTPSGLPGTPTGVSATAGAGQATVSWTAPSANGATISSYVVRYSSDSGASWTTAAGTITASPTTITGLTNGSSYIFDVAAHNANGNGARSAATTPVTPLTTPGVPTSVTVSAGDGQVSVSWVAPSSNGGSAVTGYDVQSSSDNGAHWSSPFASAQSSTATAALVTGLTNGTTYVFQVAARNVLGHGAFSPNTSAVMPAGAPLTPTSVSATAGDQQATVTWTPASDGGSPITSYDVRYSSSGGTSWTSAGVAYAGTPAVVTGLTNGTSYVFDVRAINAIGASGHSIPSSVAVTPSGLPGQPTAVSATAGNAQATVSWTAPLANGASITSYVVRYSSNSGTNWTMTAGPITGSPATVTGLTNGTGYVFDVTAHNVNGDGTRSTPSTSVTPATRPAAPANVTAIAGDQQASVSWLDGSNGGASITAYQVRFSSDSGQSWIVAPGTIAASPATVTGLTNGTSYLFDVAASNTAGTSDRSLPSVAVTPAGLPAAPTAVSAVPGNVSASVSWTAPAANGSPISSYVVSYSGDGGSTWTTAAGPFTSSPASVTGLTNGTSYLFRVAAHNGVGIGATSVPSTAVIPSTTPGVPAFTTVTAGIGQVSLTWSAPSNGGSVLTGYAVEWSPVGGSWSSPLDSALTSTGTTATVTGLTNGTSYRFRVAAINARGTGAFSDPSAPALPDDYPGAPTSVTALPANGSATVSWIDPAPHGTPVSSYDVRYSSNDGGSWTSVTGPVTASPLTVSGLTNGTTYRFEVAAINGLGEGAFSTTSSPTTPATTPDAPTQVSGVAGPGQVTVSWQPGGSNGGSTVTAYEVRWSTNGGSSWTSAGTAFTSSPVVVTGLTNGSHYVFDVMATNAAGDSLRSTQSGAVTPATVPSAPTLVSATPGLRSATISWATPVDGGSAISSYDVRYSSNGGASWTSAGAAYSGSPASVSNLTDGATYLFDVAAINGVGAGARSIASTAITLPSAPDAVTAVGTTAGAAQVTLTWSAPAANGTPITGYKVDYASASSQGTWTTLGSALSSADTSAVVDGLSNGTAYVFRVAAVNAAGTGTASPTTAAVTPITTPGVPTAVTAVAADRQAAVGWTSPVDNGGSAVTSYEVRYAVAGTTSWVDMSGPFTASPVLVTGLANGTSYVFDVSAVNAAGRSARSTQSAAVTPATVPDAPTLVSATPGVRSATVSWAAPADGGSAISSYDVRYSSNGGNSWTSAGVAYSGSPVTVTGLTDGATYVFDVVAINPVGAGARSIPSTAITLPSAPAAVTGVTAGRGNQQATVRWAAPSANGSPITGYLLRVSSDNGTTWTDAGSFPTSPADVTGLANGTTYVFDVAAVNAVATGAFSELSPSVTPATAPATPTGLVASAADAQVTLGWSAPTNGGSPVTGYQVDYSANDGQSWTPFVPALTSVATQSVITGLTNGTAYRFRVAAVNDLGAGAYSATTGPVTPATLPAPPTFVSAVAGDRQAVVNWTAPSSNGGSAISSYDVRYSSNGGTSWTSAGVAYLGGPATVTGLTNGAPYLFAVAAINGVGSSGYSAASSVATPLPHTSALAQAASTTVSYGATLTLTTTLLDSTTHTPLAATPVALYYRPNSSTPFKVVKALTTSGGGTASYAVKPGTTTTYAWQFAGSPGHAAATSPLRTISVAQVVTVTQSATRVAHGAVVKFYGTVSPNELNQYVYLQRKSGTAWKTLAVKGKIVKQKMPNGKTVVGYVLSLKTTSKGTFTYRAYRPATSTNSLGTSVSKVLRVT